MNSEIAVKVDNISKSFRVPHEKHSSLKSAAVDIFTPKKYTNFKALEGINFEIKKGEFFGIVGRNGCGKSTLLKILANIYQPTKGKVKIGGTLAPFIELGVGFNPELTGRENVYLSGTILGMKRQEIQSKFSEIVKFAELGDFMDQKLKNFSSGMQVRLAFSIAIQGKSDVMLIDEVLAVGDTSFQKKCFNQFKTLKKEGRTIVFVTHDMESVLEFCDRVLVISEGKQLVLTDPEKAKSVYDELNAKNDLKQIEQVIDSNRSGDGHVKIEEVELIGDKGNPTQVFKTGEKLLVRIKTTKTKEKTPISVGIAFYSQENVNISGPNSLNKKFLAGDTVEYSITRLPLVEGTYSLTVGVFDETAKTTYDFIEKGFAFSVVSPRKQHGNTVFFGNWSEYE